MSNFLLKDRPPHTEPLVNLLADLVPRPVQVRGGSLTSLSPFTSQAGCENPSISLHVIGLNGPTHDLEMMPPDDPRMRFAPFPQLC